MLQKQKQRQKAIDRVTLERVLNSLEGMLLVTDAETGEILFANSKMCQLYNVEAPEGQICWEAFYGRESRCAHCPRLSLQEGALPYHWVERDKKDNGVFHNCDQLIRWVDGRLAHMQESIDVTDQEELREEVMRDALTGALNRRAGMAAFNTMRGRAAIQRCRFTMCLIDCNELRIINDNFGREIGDMVLQETVKACRRIMNPEDIFYRTSGDEFIMLLYNCNDTEAAARIERAQEYLVQQGEELGLSGAFASGFSYGVRDVYPEDPATFREIFDQADSRMYQQQRKRHIRQAAQRAQLESMYQPAETEFEYSEAMLYPALVQSTEDYPYVCNMKTGLFRYPPTLVAEFDLPGEVVANAAAVWENIVHPHDRMAFLEANQEIADGRSDSHSVEFRAKNNRGEWVWLRCRGHLERDENGEPVLFAGIMTNLGRQSRVDPLTGISNKFALERRVDDLTRKGEENRFSFLLLDLDDFKYINDLYDRQFGDGVLRMFSHRIQALLPSNALVFRMDGDEFGVLIRGGGRTIVEDFYREVKDSFDGEQEYEGKRFFCTVSGGCSRFPQDADNYLDLMKYAHYSLEYAKSNGKNRLMLFSKEIMKHRERSLIMNEELRDCVEHDMRNFSVVYQPEVDAGTGALCGAEALLRWHSERFGDISPVEFIPLLEESGLIRKAGRWVFEQAAYTCARWAVRQGGFFMSVNVSYLQMEDPEFLEFLRKTMAEAGTDPKRMVLEFTESCIAYNQETLTGVFTQLRDLGIKIAMDDFGTGYSSLGILKQTPADIVKIDRTFVKGIKNSTFDTTFIRFIVELCHAVDITVCLEGVETPEEYEIVRPMRLDCIQGYLFGRPQPPAQFESLFG